MSYCNQTQNILDTLDKLKVEDSWTPKRNRTNNKSKTKTHIDTLIDRVQTLENDNYNNKIASLHNKKGEVVELLELLNLSR
jgi:hypothetical protein